MLKIIFAITFALFLMGCDKNVAPQVEPPVRIIHPELPQPVSTYKFDWKVVESENIMIVGLEYDQSIDFRVFLEDMKRFIREQQAVTCSYRRELKEPICDTFIVPKK